jgi:hypothetical protein
MERRQTRPQVIQGSDGDARPDHAPRRRQPTARPGRVGGLVGSGHASRVSGHGTLKLRAGARERHRPGGIPCGPRQQPPPPSPPRPPRRHQVPGKEAGVRRARRAKCRAARSGGVAPAGLILPPAHRWHRSRGGDLSGPVPTGPAAPPWGQLAIAGLPWHHPGHASAARHSPGTPPKPGHHEANRRALQAARCGPTATQAPSEGDMWFINY